MRISQIVIAIAMTTATFLFANESAWATAEIDFTRDVQPIFAKACWSCHGVDKQEAGLRLDRGDLAMLGGDSGKAILPGNSDQSRLIQYVTATDSDKVMPPEGPRLSQADIESLRRWIDQGAVWPKVAGSAISKNEHWAYQPLASVVPPHVDKLDWSVNPIDRFVLAKLESHGIAPSPEADRYTLIRRLNLDLIGLLPTVDEVDAFYTDASPDAYEKVVDRLLRSPHFGERWGRHWLDMARYADSDGYEKDNPRPDAFLWRDWVIKAINDDMPLDQFTIEQLAGDLLPNATQSQRLATAFHRQTLTNTEGGADQEEFRVAACFDRTETTGAVWLGLTVGCARCHSHKYDAISQREYYQLFAFFNNGDEQTFNLPKSDDEIRQYHQTLAKHEEAVAKAKAELKEAQKSIAPLIGKWELETKQQIEAATEKDKLKIPKNIVSVLELSPDKRSDKQEQELLEYFSNVEPTTKPLAEKLSSLQKKAPGKPEWTVRVLGQRTKDPRTTFVLRRGEFLEPLREAQVQPNGLSTLPPMPLSNDGEFANRLDLARWLVSNENPLTPRVAVNHVWRALFGAGIVRTANDFGVRGEPPTHPELLDWLARELIGLNRNEHGAGTSPTQSWSRKSLIKLIVMSATYRQSSHRRNDLFDVDPQNRLLAAQNRLRVEGEVVRDIALDAAGLLVRDVGGPSVFPALPPGIADLSYAGNFKWTMSDQRDRYRRGMYTFFKRTAPHPNLITFDCPDANVTCVERSKSNTPLQALVALNNESFNEAAQAFAKRMLESNVLTNDVDRINTAFRMAVARLPSEDEVNVLLQLLVKSRTWYADHAEEAKEIVGEHAAAGIDVRQNAAWVATLRVLLNLDEFITRE